MKSVFISQSNYIPWRGYFDAINSVDEFIILDDVQYTKRDWRNRNKIKTSIGDHWLSIPIEVKNKFHQKIKDARISDPDWAVKHWKTLQTNYAAAPFFKQYAAVFENLYLNKKYTLLSEVNYAFLKLVCTLLEIKTNIRHSSEFDLHEKDPSDRLLTLCKAVGATDYYSGPAAKAYLDETIFAQNAVRVHYFDFEGYAPYKQLHGEFMNHLSVLDLLFNVGPEAKKYLHSNQLLHQPVEMVV